MTRETTAASRPFAGAVAAAVCAVALVAPLAACSDPERVRRTIEQSSAPESRDTATVAEETLPGSGLVGAEAQDGRAQSGALTVPAVYVVRAGDTLFAVALRYGLPMRSIIALNAMRPPYHLRQGEELALPQQRVHVVVAGDSLYGISRQYGTDLASLSRLNQLSPPYGIQTGQRLLIPSRYGAEVAAEESDSFQPAAVSEDTLSDDETDNSAAVAVVDVSDVDIDADGDGSAGAVTVAAEEEETEDAPPLSVVSGEPPPREGPGFLWPLHGDARLLERFGPQSGGRHNDGLNLASDEGSDILAAENGVVAYVGDELIGFGQLMLIRHSDGWVTAYAHAQGFSVGQGDVVRRGQIIGKVGSTGGVAEPQLHFELRRKTRAIDPLTLLERQS
ncbi:MAG: peptidoglycan DD-metalloendopeptidase family protein [Alphaproteobacteria bacterium]|nr:peptidoglycan DD-metalloendopeptidase family protein [Alphaproteobacteria bacterium]MDA7983829.1 peptidoglycan DD-metalloendopeptidase family protein [Alphaproteobacteria bacterium]MDA7988300.1 peptidoglycan DD-metalloendopeptidase family protein [Alphaproteobacteria bacterium]MDA8008535.1 peptidoglycan DD-metalloendopeptidase family protein [Alphaproteobacteria bacterium]